MLHVTTLLVAHGDHASLDAWTTLLHLLHPQHWAVPVLAVLGAVLAVRVVRRGTGPAS